MSGYTRVIHRGKRSTVYEHTDTVSKVYESIDSSTAANEIAVAMMEWSGVLVRTIPHVLYDRDTHAMSITQERGDPCHCVVTYDDILDIILSYARMEARGMIHGDICPRNIVRARGRLVPIDFGIISTRMEAGIELQSIKEVSGHAYCAGYVVTGYNAINSAIYALGVTICMLLGLIPKDLDRVSLDTVEGIEVRIDAVSTYINTNVDDLCQKHPPLRRMLPRNRVQSFWPLLNLDTRWIYDKCASEFMSCKETATVYEGYYRYGTADRDDLLCFTRGEHVTWIEDPNQTLRLLREYHASGSWYLPCEKCETTEQLLGELSELSPKVVIYCFGGITMYYSRD